MVQAIVYFLMAGANVCCKAEPFRLGAAAMALIFSFFGFLASLLPRCSPLAIVLSLLSAAV